MNLTGKTVLLARIRRYMDRKKSGDKVLFTGKFLNTNQIKTVTLTDMVKTEDFGGQVGGKKINLGIQFENQFYESLRCELGCSNKNTRYASEAKRLITEIGNSEKSGFSDVEAVGD